MYVYGEVHATAGHRVRIDYNIPKAADTEMTASTHVGHDVKLYLPANLGTEGTTSSGPNVKCIYDLIEDGDQHLIAHAS